MKPRFSVILFSGLCLFLANCKGTKGGYASADPATPGRHGMSQSEYPFDEYGNYREDWVRKGGSSKPSYAAQYEGADVIDLTKDNPTSPFRGTSEATDFPKEKSTSSAGGSRPKTTPKKTTASTKPKPKSKPVAKSSTVTVKKGDTLFALAKRHGTSVKAIQSANGMGSSTVLRDGRSLKIPKK